MGATGHTMALRATTLVVLLTTAGGYSFLPHARPLARSIHGRRHYSRCVRMRQKSFMCNLEPSCECRDSLLRFSVGVCEAWEMRLFIHASACALINGRCYYVTVLALCFMGHVGVLKAQPPSATIFLFLFDYHCCDTDRVRLLL